MTRYYYQQMEPLAQEVYRALEEGLEQVRPSIVVPRLEGKRVGEVLFQLRLDCPALFYVTGASYRAHPAGNHLEVLPQYLFPKAKILTHRKAIAAPCSTNPPGSRNRPFTTYSVPPCGMTS